MEKQLVLTGLQKELWKTNVADAPLFGLFAAWKDRMMKRVRRFILISRP